MGIRWRKAGPVSERPAHVKAMILPRQRAQGWAGSCSKIAAGAALAWAAMIDYERGHSRASAGPERMLKMTEG